MDDLYLETFYLIWLDANPAETSNTEQKLRCIVNHLKKFQDVQLCQNFIEKRSKNDRLIMIVSSRLGQKIVPHIHHLRQVISIYVYCMNKTYSKEWASKYKKVKAFITEFDKLVSCIKDDHKIQKVAEEPLSINIFNTSGGAGNATTGVTGDFIFSQVLIDCLLPLKSDKTDREELIELLKRQYADNKYEMNLLAEFEANYSPDKVLWWYTRESFFYKSLNTALRHRNIHHIFLFREFIADMDCQLKKYQTQDAVQVYRGQLMSINELKRLQECCGQLISINSFFSTTTDEKLAQFYIAPGPIADGIVPTLFQISASPQAATKKSFSNISSLSDFPNELETLFMLGSIFRVDNVGCSSNSQVWIIRMTLCRDDEHDLVQVLANINERFGSGKPNLQTLGTLLSYMGENDLAEKYLIRLLKQLSPNDSLRLDLYQDLANVTAHNRKLNESTEWHKRALAFKQRLISICSPTTPKSSISTESTKTSTEIDATASWNNSTWSLPNIPANARWKQNGVTVAGGSGKGDATNQLHYPLSLCVDDNQAVIIVEQGNHRITQWNKGDTNGKVIAGGNGQGNRLDQLNSPTDVLIDKETDSLIIADYWNYRVVQWSRRSGTKQGEILIDNIHCFGLGMDDQRYLYVSDHKKREVSRYRLGDNNGTLVAGGNGKGNGLNQFNEPTYLFVDRQQNVYVSDNNNHRVMKWNKDAKEGIVVAGGNGYGNALAQLSSPSGIFVDTLGTLYVADSNNDRVMCWSQGNEQGAVIVDGNGAKARAVHFSWPTGLSFDHHGNLYVAGYYNHRVRRFDIE